MDWNKPLEDKTALVILVLFECVIIAMTVWCIYNNLALPSALLGFADAIYLVCIHKVYKQIA